MHSTTDVVRRPAGSYAERQHALRLQLLDARRRGDTEQARRVCRRLDNLFVARAHHRAGDPEICRLRRQVRAAA